jgi:Anthrone oxygenase
MNIWAILMLVSGGLFAGGALAIAWERIPVWRTMSPAQYVTDFAETIHRADRVQPALLVVAIVTALGFGIGASATARTLALIGAAGFIVTLIASVAVLVPLQRRIIAASPQPPDAIEAMRRRWFTGHLGRSALAAACFTLAAVAAVA